MDLSTIHTIFGNNVTKCVTINKLAAVPKEIIMKQLILILLILGLFSCDNIQQLDNKSKNIPKENIQEELIGFNLISDFETNKAQFNSDTFDLMNLSTEGGELIVFHTNKKEYLVIDIWLYGEMGKLNTTYWTDKNIEFKFIKKTKYNYDRPMYEPDYKIIETTYYYSYPDSNFIIYNLDRKEIQDSSYLVKRKEIEEFFTTVTKDIEIIK